MSEQEQNQTQQETEGAAESKTPDCCGPEMARKMEACCPQSSRERESDATSDETRWPSFCEKMMAKLTDGEDSMKACPMSSMFKKTSGKRGFALLATIPGLLFVVAGVAIIL